MRKCMMIYKRNLPLLPRQLFPRQVPRVTHIRQDIPITAGMLGADLYPPAFWHENKFILATNLMAVSTLMASDFKSSKYNNCQLTWIIIREKLQHLYKYFSLVFLEWPHVWYEELASRSDAGCWRRDNESSLWTQPHGGSLQDSCQWQWPQLPTWTWRPFPPILAILA